MAEISAQELNPRDRKRFENASLAKERGNYEYAIDICCELLAAEPACLEARDLLRRSQQTRFTAKNSPFVRLAGAVYATFAIARGKSHLKRSPSRAMDFGERALCCNPFHGAALRLIAEGASRLELFDTAVYCLRGLAESHPRDINILFTYCEALIKAGETDLAIATAERLNQLKPDAARLQELAKAASVAHSINKGKWAEKGADFRGKLKNREESDRLERESRLASGSGDGTSREQDLKDAIRQDPQDVEPYKKLIRLYVDKEDYVGALAWLERAYALPHSEGDVFLRQMRGDLGMKQLENEISALAAEEDSDNVSRIQELERKLETLRLDEAGKLVEQFPNDYSQRLKYGAFLLGAGRVDEAIQQFQVSQRSPNLKAKSLVLLGRSFMAKGLHDLGLEQLDLAMKGLSAMDAFRKDTLYLSAECCEQLGQREEAMRRYKLIYSSDIGYRDVATKVDAYYSDGDS